MPDPNRPLEPSHTPEEEIARGRRAHEILSDPLVSESMEAIELRLMKKWRQTQLSQTEVREKVFLILRAKDEFEQQLRHIVETGKMAEQAEEEKRAK